MIAPAYNQVQQNLDWLRGHSSAGSVRELEECTPAYFDAVGEHGRRAFYAVTEGVRFLLQSTRDPIAEAERQVDSWLERNPLASSQTIVVIGVGLLEHIKALLRKTGPDDMVIVLDPSPALVKAALDHCDLTELDNTQTQVLFSVNENVDTMGREFRCYFNERKSFNLSVFVHPGCRRAFRESYDRLLEAVKSEVALESMQRNTMSVLADEWQQHAIYNIPYLLNAPKINALKGKFADLPAIVVAAGPSLNSSLPYIAQVADRAVIFAVGTALKPLLNYGVEPDFVVAIDSDPKTLKQYEGIDEGRIFLLTTSIMLPDLVYRFRDRMFVFTTTALTGFNEWWSAAGGETDLISVGGTVTVSAIDIAAYCGCSKIILTGFDLAYLNDGTTHANGSMYDGVRSETTDLVKVPGNYDDWVWTSKQFSCYIDILKAYLQDLLEMKDVEVYNATKGGARLHGSQLIEPSVIPAYLLDGLPYDKKSQIEHLHSESQPIPIERVHEQIQQTLIELSEVKAATENAMSACDVVLENPENIRFGGILTHEMDRLDGVIQERRSAASLLTGALQAVFQDVYNTTDGGDVETLKRNRRFYEHLHGAAEWITGMMKAISANLTNKQYNFKIGS